MPAALSGEYPEARRVVMLMATRTGVALAAFFCASAAHASAPAGSAGTILQVGATVVRPVSVERTGTGAVRISSTRGANITVSAGAVERSGSGVLIRPPGRAAGSSPLVVTIEY
jgi:hypothetical protein